MAPIKSPIGTRSQIQKQSINKMALADFTLFADQLLIPTKMTMPSKFVGIA